MPPADAGAAAVREVIAAATERVNTVRAVRMVMSQQRPSSARVTHLGLYSAGHDRSQRSWLCSPRRSAWPRHSAVASSAAQSSPRPARTASLSAPSRGSSGAAGPRGLGASGTGTGPGRAGPREWRRARVVAVPARRRAVPGAPGAERPQSTEGVPFLLSGGERPPLCCREACLWGPLRVPGTAALRPSCPGLERCSAPPPRRRSRAPLRVVLSSVRDAGRCVSQRTLPGSVGRERVAGICPSPPAACFGDPGTGPCTPHG